MNATSTADAWSFFAALANIVNQPKVHQTSLVPLTSPLDLPVQPSPTSDDSWHTAPSGQAPLAAETVQPPPGAETVQAPLAAARVPARFATANSFLTATWIPTADFRSRPVDLPAEEPAQLRGANAAGPVYPRPTDT